MEDFKKILTEAEQGDITAMWETAKFLLKNHSTPDYETEALKWLTIYEKGNKIEAMKNLANLYGQIYETDIDKFNKIIEWYSNAAKLGDCYSMVDIGQMYFVGEYVEKNYEEAFKWFKKARELGSNRSNYYLGLCYAKGLGVLQNDLKAIEYFRIFYYDGYVGVGIEALADTYYEDYSIPDNKAKAFKYYKI